MTALDTAHSLNEVIEYNRKRAPMTQHNTHLQVSGLDAHKRTFTLEPYRVMRLCQEAP